jgi:hypothetical protein
MGNVNLDKLVNFSEPQFLIAMVPTLQPHSPSEDQRHTALEAVSEAW